MSVRLRLALTLLITGVVTALGVLVAVALAFERFEREAAYARADAFLGRVVALHDDLPAQQRREPEAFTAFLRSLLLFEPDSQLYLLAPDGTVRSSTGSKALASDFKVAIAPVREAAAQASPVPASAHGAAPASPTTAPTTAPSTAPSTMPARREGAAAYVMGDDPEHMADDAVIAARALSQPSIRPGADVAGYLYLVARKPGLPPSRVARLAGQLAGPALGPVLAVVLLATLLAAWIIAAVTRPLALLSSAVAEATRAGFSGPAPALLAAAEPRGGHARASDDEFGRLHTGFRMLLAKLHAQWDQLKRLDAFRRESVSNLSHDLRSPLTAAAASLETLQQRMQARASARAGGRAQADANAATAAGAGAEAGTEAAAAAAEAEEAMLVEVALRNTHNAARLVRALGDLAMLDEAGFRLRLARLDLAEMLDDIVLRFAERAAHQGVTLTCEIEGEIEGGLDPEHDGAGANVDAGMGHEVGSQGGSTQPLAAEVDVELIERAIANLLDNALRHTPAAGRVVLSARRHRGPEAEEGVRADGAPHVRVQVQDSGSGIAAEDLEHLFDRHFRGGRGGGEARTDGGGKGLGLAIVQRIVELHEGRLAISSVLGAGTTVTLDLPVARAG